MFKRKIISVEDLKLLEVMLTKEEETCFFDELHNIIINAQQVHKDLPSILLDAIHDQIQQLYTKHQTKLRDQQRNQMDCQKLSSETKIHNLEKEIIKLKNEINQAINNFPDDFKYTKIKNSNVEGDYNLLNELIKKTIADISNEKHKISTKEYLKEKAEARLADLLTILPAQKNDIEKYLLSYQEILLVDLKKLQEELLQKQKIISEDSFRDFIYWHLAKHQQRYLSTFQGKPDSFLPYITKEYLKRFGYSVEERLLPKSNSKGKEPHFYIKETRDFSNNKEVVILDEQFFMLVKQTFVAHLLRTRIPQILLEVGKKIASPIHNLFWQVLQTEIIDLFTQGSYVHLLNLNHASLQNKKLGQYDALKFLVDDFSNGLFRIILRIANLVMEIGCRIHERKKPMLKLLHLAQTNSITAKDYAESALASFKMINNQMENGQDLFIEEIEYGLLKKVARDQKKLNKQLDELNAITAKINTLNSKNYQIEELAERIADLSNITNDENQNKNSEMQLLSIIEKIEKRKESFLKYIQQNKDEEQIIEQAEFLGKITIFDKTINLFKDIAPGRVYQVSGYEEQPLLISFDQKLFNSLLDKEEDSFLKEIVKNTKKGVVNGVGENGLKYSYSYTKNIPILEIKFKSSKNGNKRIIGYPLASNELVYCFSKLIAEK